MCARLSGVLEKEADRRREVWIGGGGGHRALHVFPVGTCQLPFFLDKRRKEVPPSAGLMRFKCRDFK